MTQGGTVHWSVFEEVLNSQLPLPDNMLEHILGRAAQTASKCTEEQAATLLKVIHTALTLYKSQVVKLESWPVLYVVILSACVKHASVLPVSNKRLAWAVLVQLTSSLLLAAQLRSVFPGVYLAACTEVLIYRDKSHGANADSTVCALNVLTSLFEECLVDSAEGPWVDEARSRLTDKVGSLIAALSRIVKDGGKVKDAIRSCIAAMLQCRRVVRVAELVRCMVELHKHCPVSALIDSSIDPSQHACIKDALTVASELLVTLEELWGEVGRSETVQEKASSLRGLLSCMSLVKDRLPTYLMANSASVLAHLDVLCQLKTVKVREVGVAQWHRYLDFAEDSPELFDLLQAVINLVLPGIEDDVGEEVRLLSGSKASVPGLTRLANRLFILRTSQAYQGVISSCKELVFSTTLHPDLLPSLQLVADLVLEALVSQRDSDGAGLCVDCLQLSHFTTVSASEALRLPSLEEFIRTHYDSIKPSLLTRLGYSNNSILRALSEVVSSVPVQQAEGLIAHTLKVYDRRHHRFVVSEHLAYLTFFKKLLQAVVTAINSAELPQGTLLWSVLIRVRPLLSWKGSASDQRRLAGEVLELIVQHAETLSKVSVEVNTSQFTPFQIEDACNASIPLWL
jgi:hypothetical protein